MLYLVSGTSRSGKTMIAQKILKAKAIPYFSLDWIVMGFTNGMPQCGIHDKLFPDEIAVGIRDFLESMCASMLWDDVDYVIEGEAILPESARKLLDQHAENIRVCYVGYTDIDVNQKVQEVKTYSVGERDWLLQESEVQIRKHIENMVTYSRKVKQECEQHNVRYFDTSSAFLSTIDKATEYLLTGA